MKPHCGGEIEQSAGLASGSEQGQGDGLGEGEGDGEGVGEALHSESVIVWHRYFSPPSITHSIEPNATLLQKPNSNPQLTFEYLI
jgi:hypothetical protein